jgi:hypothetical protein
VDFVEERGWVAMFFITRRCKVKCKKVEFFLHLNGCVK